jgi:hypothetical protein
MEAIRLETTIETDGVIAVESLRAGERVEVIVLRLDSPPKSAYPLRGTPGRYDNPFEPSLI